MLAGGSALFAVVTAPTWVRDCVECAEEETSTLPPLSLLFSFISFSLIEALLLRTNGQMILHILPRLDRAGGGQGGWWLGSFNFWTLRNA